MNGVELTIRFAYIVNFLRYCGPKCASEQFLEYFNKKISQEEALSLLKKFEGLHVYLEALSEKSGQPYASDQAAEAYWIGNELLDLFDNEDMARIIHSLTKRGLPPSLAQRLISSMPNGLFPHHNFNVFYVGVGNTTGHVPTTLLTMDKCRITSGTVKEVRETTLLVSYAPLAFKENKLVFASEKDIEVSYLPEMLASVRKGDTVALHWDFAPVLLSEDQANKIKQYSQLLMDRISFQALADR
ncbi:MAG: hypothetical protein H6502_00140 [Candidatus Woesearchaeota archaeon]|nr:MAG: hypothetical protein H6502_00140 [Candidatus Woesearchaeota archaeon]